MARVALATVSAEKWQDSTSRMVGRPSRVAFRNTPNARPHGEGSGSKKGSNSGTIARIARTTEENGRRPRRAAQRLPQAIRPYRLHSDQGGALRLTPRGMSPAEMNGAHVRAPTARRARYWRHDARIGSPGAVIRIGNDGAQRVLAHRTRQHSAENESAERRTTTAPRPHRAKPGADNNTIRAVACRRRDE